MILKLKKLIDGSFLLRILCNLFIIISLFLPWYNINVRIEEDLWYTFSYSPLKRIIDVGKISSVEYFYRYDTTIVGLLILFISLGSHFLYNFNKFKILSPLVMLVLITLFPTFLPIHVTTAYRLSIGQGTYIAILGTLSLVLSMIYEIVKEKIQKIVTKFIKFPLFVKIFILSNIFYYVINYLSYKINLY